MNEFDLIRQFFCFSKPQLLHSGLEAGGTATVALGVGDDCALLNIPDGWQLAVTTDTLVSGVHFPAGADASLVARRALRVNLSDLAAMAATPLAFQLALTLPEVDDAWLKLFSAGLAEDAERHVCPLVGGDTTHGPLSITITMMGTVPHQRVLRRTGSRPGDIICVSGVLGDAAAALDQLSEEFVDQPLLKRYWLPEPRLALGLLLAGKATSCLDISDGLVQDVGHIARANGLSAVIEKAKVPVSAALIERAGVEAAQTLALHGGDDYELCFTIGEAALVEIEHQAAEQGCEITRIGHMVPLSPDGEHVVCLDSFGKPLNLPQRGYDHFQR